jgi:hypothetical protein
VGAHAEFDSLHCRHRLRGRCKVYTYPLMVHEMGPYKVFQNHVKVLKLANENCPTVHPTLAVERQQGV